MIPNSVRIKNERKTLKLPVKNTKVVTCDLGEAPADANAADQVCCVFRWSVPLRSYYRKDLWLSTSKMMIPMSKPALMTLRC